MCCGANILAFVKSAHKRNHCQCYTFIGSIIMIKTYFATKDDYIALL